MEIVCPRCKKSAIYEGNPFRPFCSERCKIIDLGNWASEKYAVPIEGADEKNQSQHDSEDQNLDKPKK